MIFWGPLCLSPILLVFGNDFIIIIDQLLFWLPGALWPRLWLLGWLVRWQFVPGLDHGGRGQHPRLFFKTLFGVESLRVGHRRNWVHRVRLVADASAVGSGALLRIRPGNFSDIVERCEGLVRLVVFGVFVEVDLTCLDDAREGPGADVERFLILRNIFWHITVVIYCRL